MHSTKLGIGKRKQAAGRQTALFPLAISQDHPGMLWASPRPLSNSGMWGEPGPRLGEESSLEVQTVSSLLSKALFSSFLQRVKPLLLNGQIQA